MTTLLKILVACIALATVLLAIVLTITGLWLLAILALVCGAGWAVLEYRNWPHAASPGLVVNSFLLALGMLNSTPATWMIPIGVLTLAAWDLSRFRQRLKLAGDRSTAALERFHLLRLAWVSGVGLILAELAGVARLSLSFALIFFLGVILLVVLYQVVARLAKS